MTIFIPDPVGPGDDIVLPDPLPPLALLAQRRVTKQFIDVVPTTVTLIPHERVKKPAGGFVFEARAPRAPQVMTIIEPGGNQPRPLVTADGVDREVDFELLGEWDAQMARRDVFYHQGKEWEVVEMFYDNGYETRALVSARG